MGRNYRRLRRNIIAGFDKTRDGITNERNKRIRKLGILKNVLRCRGQLAARKRPRRGPRGGGRPLRAYNPVICKAQIGYLGF